MENKAQIDLLTDKIITWIDKIQAIRSKEDIQELQQTLFEYGSKVEQIKSLQVLKEIERVLRESMSQMDVLRMIESVTAYIGTLISEEDRYSDEQLINSKAIFELKKEFIINQNKYAEALMQKHKLEQKAKTITMVDPEYFLIKSDYDNIERLLASFTKIFKVLYQKLQNSNITRDLILQIISVESIKKIKDLTEADAKAMKDKLNSDLEDFEDENRKFVSIDQDYGQLLDELITLNEVTQIYNEVQSTKIAYLRYVEIPANKLAKSIEDLTTKVENLEKTLTNNSLPQDLQPIYDKIHDAIELALDAYISKSNLRPELNEKLDQVELKVESNDLEVIIQSCIDQFNPPAIDVAYFKIRKYIELFFKLKHNMNFFEEPYVSIKPIERFKYIFNSTEALELSKIWGTCNNYIHGTMDYFKKMNNHPETQVEQLLKDFEVVKRLGAFVTKEDIKNAETNKKAPKAKAEIIVNDNEQYLLSLRGMSVEGVIDSIMIKSDGPSKSYKYGFIRVRLGSPLVYFNDKSIDFVPIKGKKVKFILQVKKNIDRFEYRAEQLQEAE